MYPPLGEKSMQLTFPMLLDVVGKLENTVLDGTCNYKKVIIHNVLCYTLEQ